MHDVSLAFVRSYKLGLSRTWSNLEIAVEYHPPSSLREDSGFVSAVLLPHMAEVYATSPGLVSWKLEYLYRRAEYPVMFLTLSMPRQRWRSLQKRSSL